MNAKRNSEEAIKRRVRAGRLLLAGKSPPEVARLVGAPRQTVYRWREVLDASGTQVLSSNVLLKRSRSASISGP